MSVYKTSGMSAIQNKVKDHGYLDMGCAVTMHTNTRYSNTIITLLFNL